MSFMDKGLAWFEQMRQRHLVESVTVENASGKRERRATVIDPESNVNSEGVRVISNTYTFIFEASPDLSFNRGDKIRRHSRMGLYQVVNIPNTYNDPNNLGITVEAVLCSSPN